MSPGSNLITKVRSLIEADLSDLGALPEREGRCEVTPEMAVQWLRRNRANRRIGGREIEFLVGELKEKLWRYNGQTVSFSKTGGLLDGQHRLAGIAATGIAAPINIALDIDDDAFMTIDSGRGRDFADVLFIRGVQYASHVAAAIRIAIAIEAGRSSSRGTGRVPSEILLKHADAHPELINRVTHYSHNRMSGTNPFLRLCPASITGYLDWRFHQADPALADEFMNGLVTGVGLEAGSPILFFRNTLEGRMQERHRRMGQFEIIVLAIKTWNAWRAGEPIKQLKIVPGETFPTVEGRDTTKTKPPIPPKPAGYQRGTLHLRRGAQEPAQ